jgi:hypothetical protein
MQRSTYCTDFVLYFIIRPFATKSLNNPLIKRPVPVHLHVVISDDSPQNIWTVLNITLELKRVSMGHIKSH